MTTCKDRVTEPPSCVWIVYSYDYYPSIECVFRTEEEAAEWANSNWTTKYYLPLLFGEGLPEALTRLGRPQLEKGTW